MSVLELGSPVLSRFDASDYSCASIKYELLRKAMTLTAGQLLNMPIHYLGLENTYPHELQNVG